MEKNKENFVRFVYNEPNKKESPILEKLILKVESPDEVSYVCPLCSKPFSQKSSLSRHMKIHEISEGHFCTNCPKSFAAARDLRKHVDIVHLNKAEEYKRECPICHIRVQQLKTHIRFIHRNEGKNSEFNGVCSICYKTFSNDYKVKRHIETVHEGVKHYQCHICPKKFYERKDLGRHVKGVHMGQKVDTWRSKNNLYQREEQMKKGFGRNKIPSQVIVTKNILSTVDSSGSSPHSLPVNLLAGECDDKEVGVGMDPSEVPHEGAGTVMIGREDGQFEEMEVDSTHNEEGKNLRFQVSDQRVDDEGNIVLEIVEKQTKFEKAAREEQKMVTLRWGDPAGSESGADPLLLGQAELSSQSHSTPAVSTADLLKLETDADDIFLPADAGDCPLFEDWPPFHESSEMDILKSACLPCDTEGKEDSVKSKRPASELNERTAFRCGSCQKLFISLEFLKSHIEKSHIQRSDTNKTDNSINSKVTPTKTIFKLKNKKSPSSLVEKVQYNSTGEDRSAEDAPDGGDAGDEADLVTAGDGQAGSDAVIICDKEGCSRQFTGKGRKLQYKRHVERIHLAVKDKQCPQCELKFYEKRDLTRHVEAIHQRIRTICPIEGCGRPVVRLDQHIKMIHTDKTSGKEKKESSSCPECGATFGRVYDMTRHRENVHRGVKQFCCQKCDRKFSDKRDLKRHHDAVHLNIKQTKVYSCNFCEKSFKFKKILDAHRLSDHDENIVEKDLSENLSPASLNSSVVVTVNNLHSELAGLPRTALLGETELVAGEEGINTVEIEGQLFVVQQSEAGLALLPVLQADHVAAQPYTEHPT